MTDKTARTIAVVCIMALTYYIFFIMQPNNTYSRVDNTQSRPIAISVVGDATNNNAANADAAVDESTCPTCGANIVG